MMRGTFGNVRIKNALTPEKEGNWTVHIPSGEVMSIFDAAMKYQREGTPLVVLTGKEYGTGSSRDWAAKGPALQGVRAVVAESYERSIAAIWSAWACCHCSISRKQPGRRYGLSGRETIGITGIARD